MGYDINSDKEKLLNEKVRSSRLFNIHKLYFEYLEQLIKAELVLLDSKDYNLITAKDTSDAVKNYIDLIEQNFKLIVKIYNLPYKMDDEETDITQKPNSNETQDYDDLPF